MGSKGRWVRALWEMRPISSTTVYKSLFNYNYGVINFLYNMLYGDLWFMFELNLCNVFLATLSWLDLNHNNIYGDLLVGLTRLDLQYLDASYNGLPNSS